MGLPGAERREMLNTSQHFLLSLLILIKMKDRIKEERQGGEDRASSLKELCFLKETVSGCSYLAKPEPSREEGPC